MEARDSTVTFELWLWFLAFLYGVAGVGGGVVITSESVDGRLFLISARISSTWFISIKDSFVASKNGYYQGHWDRKFSLKHVNILEQILNSQKLEPDHTI